MTGAEVWNTSGCQPLCYVVTDGRQCLWSPNKDQYYSVTVAIQKPPSDSKWPEERPSHTWLSTSEAELKSLNIVLLSAWKKAAIWIHCGHSSAHKEYSMREKLRLFKNYSKLSMPISNPSHLSRAVEMLHDSALYKFMIDIDI